MTTDFIGLVHAFQLKVEMFKLFCQPK